MNKMRKMLLMCVMCVTMATPPDRQYVNNTKGSNNIEAQSADAAFAVTSGDLAPRANAIVDNDNDNFVDIVAQARAVASAPVHARATLARAVFAHLENDNSIFLPLSLKTELIDYINEDDKYENDKRIKEENKKKYEPIYLKVQSIFDYFETNPINNFELALCVFARAASDIGTTISVARAALARAAHDKTKSGWARQYFELAEENSEDEKCFYDYMKQGIWADARK